MQSFEEINDLNWKTAVSDSGCEDWRNHWFLDGVNSRIYNHPEHGMEIYSGARLYEDADHTVLWTKQAFTGDIKISYEFTRLDNADKCVNIIYLLATGSGVPPYDTDISKWNDLRVIPAMNMYFDHMHTYHISYAAFGMEKQEKYIRARRYVCDGLNGTEMSPDYEPESFFAPMKKQNLTFIKKGSTLYFHIQCEDKQKLCSWEIPGNDILCEGRVGLRQMYTRNSRYKNIEISML